MESVKKTALQWLEQEFVKLEYVIGVHGVMYELIDKAMEMEKEQKAEDWQLGYDACEFHNDYDELQRKPIKNPYRDKK